jgi:hypothetical protein
MVKDKKRMTEELAIEILGSREKALAWLEAPCYARQFDTE